MALGGKKFGGIHLEVKKKGEKINIKTYSGKVRLISIYTMGNERKRKRKKDVGGEERMFSERRVNHLL